MTQAIEVHQEAQIQHVNGESSSSPPVGVAQVLMMVQSAIDKGVSPEAIQKLADLSVQFQKIDAQRQFNEAFTKMQSEMPAITTSKEGPWGGEYEDLEGIMRQIRPTLEKFGFSVRFNNPLAMDSKADRIVAECILAHVGGHSEKNSCAVRPGRANKMMTESQVDAGTIYSANRHALCAMLNIRADKNANANDDARILGRLLTAEELTELQRRVRDVGADVQNLFRQAEVESWGEIRTGALRILHNFLNEKERRSKMAKQTPTPPATPPIDAPPPEVTQEQENARILAEEYVDNALGGDPNKIRSYAITHNFYKQAVVRAGGAPKTGPEWRAVAINCHILSTQKK